MQSWEQIAGVVGAIPLGGVVAPKLAVNSPLISLQKKPKSRLIVSHDQVAIRPRSRGDRASIVDFLPAFFNWNRVPCVRRIAALIP